jgi:hypothetical protein
VTCDEGLLLFVEGGGEVRVYGGLDRVGGWDYVVGV